jgi:hypothetical protein
VKSKKLNALVKHALAIVNELFYVLQPLDDPSFIEKDSDLKKLARWEALNISIVHLRLNTSQHLGCH